MKLHLRAATGCHSSYRIIRLPVTLESIQQCGVQEASITDHWWTCAYRFRHY